MANMKFYTPKFLGGSKEEAISYYEKAVEILETSHLKTDHTWIYINTVIMLAKAYEDLRHYDKSFNCLSLGNRLCKKDLDYKINDDQKLFSQIKRFFYVSL